MIIRKFTNKDRKAYKSLRLEALKEEPLAFGGSYEESLLLNDDQRRERSTPSKAITYGMFENTKAIAMSGWKSSGRKKTGHVATIWGVYVTSSARGKGMASRIFSAIFDDIKTYPNITKISLAVNVTQVAALSFYKKQGFVEVGRLCNELFYDGKYYDEIVMEYYL